MSNKKIIFTHGGGRFGNQLLNYIHLTAFGLEYKRVSIKLNSLNDYLSSGEKSFIVSNGKINLLKKVNLKNKNRFRSFFSEQKINEFPEAISCFLKPPEGPRH